MMWAAGKFVFDTLGGRVLAGAVAFLGLVAWWQLDRMSYRNEGVRHAQHDWSRASEVTADQMEAARDAVRGLDALERLRERWCTDCGGP